MSTALVVNVSMAFDGSTWKTPIETITWTNVTSYVLHQDGVSITRGRSTNRDEVRAGTCSFTLQDFDRRFDPENTAGPYYGNLNPGVPVRVRVSLGGIPLWWDGDPILWDGDQLEIDGDPYPRFFGFVEDFPQGSTDPADRRVLIPIQATDLFGMLALARQPASVLDVTALGYTLTGGYWPLGESSGTIMHDLSTNGRDGTYSPGTTTAGGTIVTPAGVRHRAVTVDGDDQGIVTVGAVTGTANNCVAALVDISQVSDLTDGDLLPIAEYGVGDESHGTQATFQWGLEVVSAAAKTARVYVTGPTLWDDYGYSATFDASYPRYVASRFSFGPFGTEHYVDGVLSASTSNPVAMSGTAVNFRALDRKSGSGFRGSVAGLLFGAEAHILAADIADLAEAALNPLDGQTTGERIGYLLDQAGHPAGDRDLAAGYTTLGPALLDEQFTLDLIRRIDQTEQGRFYIAQDGTATFHARYHSQLIASASSATFSDDGSDVRYSQVEVVRPRSFVFNKVTVTADGQGPVTVVDQVSIDTHGERETSVDAPLLSNANTQRSLAEYVLANSKDPHPRVMGMSVPLHKNFATLGPLVLPLEQGSRVNFERTPVSTGAAIDLDQILEGYTERFDSKTYTWTPHLSPAEPVTFGVWGTGTWGGSFIWGY